MSVLRHGSRRTPKLTPPSMPRMHSGQRFCQGGPSPNAGQTLPFVHHDIVPTRPAQSWDIRAEVFLDSSCTSACGLHRHLSFVFTASTPCVPQVLTVAALSVGRLASGSEHLWESTRVRPAFHCFCLFFSVPSAASISDCLQREIPRAPSVAGSVFRPWRPQLYSAILEISLDVRSSAPVDLICTLTYRNVSYVTAVCAGLRLSISMLVPLPWIAQCHPHSAWPPVEFVDMLSRLAKRQSRQRKRSGRLNRLYTDPESTGGTGGTGPAATQPADDWRRGLPEHVFLPASAPEHALTPRELALYNYTTWRTREPPPPTIYIRGALQALLRAHPRRSLVVDCDEPSPVISVEDVDPPSRPASETQAGLTDEREDSCSYTAGDITIKSRLLCAREREHQHLDDDSSVSQQETGAGSSTDKPRLRQTSGDQPRPAPTKGEATSGRMKSRRRLPLPRRRPAAAAKDAGPDTEQIVVLPSGKAYQKPKPVPKGRSRPPDRASDQPMAAGTSELQVEDVTAGLEKAREHRPCLDGDPVTFVPLPRTTALDLQPDLPDGPGLASGPQLPPAACAAAGTAPADTSGQWGTATPIPVGLPDADLSPDPSSAPAKTRTTKLRPKAKISGRLSSTTGPEAARRTARRLSSLRKPASRSSRHAAVSDVHDPTYRPDPASRPRAKSIWLADEDEALSTDIPAPSSPRPSKKSKTDHPSLANASEPSTAGQYMQSALPLFSRQCYGLQKRVCRFRTPAPRPRSSPRSWPLRFMADIAPALQPLPVRLLVWCTHTLRGVPNRRRSLTGGSSSFPSSSFRGCFLFTPAVFAHTWLSVWHTGDSPNARPFVQPPDPTSSRCPDITQKVFAGPGPKSGLRGPPTKSPWTLRLSLLPLQLMTAKAVPTYEPRVAATVTQRAAETSQTTAPPVLGVNLGVPTAQPTLSNTRKRAFLRAQKRAALSGQTQYRGRTYTAAQLQCLANPGQRRTPTTAARPALARPRMPFMIWNCGGLTSVRFKEIRHWIAQHPPMLIILLETFWKDDLEWFEPGRAGGLSFIHTGSAMTRSAGILAIIPATFAGPQSIQYDIRVPGRLMHIRLLGEPSTDLIACYQHTWYYRKEDKQSLNVRESLLTRREAFLQSFKGPQSLSTSKWPPCCGRLEHLAPS